MIDLNAVLHEHAIAAIIDLQGRLTDVNDKFYAISKYSCSELLGRNYLITDSGHHPGGFFSQLWETVRLCGVWRGEIKHRARDGSFYWAATTVLHLLDGQTGSSCFLSIGFDVTEQKCMELRLKEKRSLQRLLAEIAPGFTRVPPREVNAAIEDAQRRIVEILGLDRSMLWQMGERQGDIIATHLWWNEEKAQPPPAFPSAENLPWACARIARGEIICFSSLDALPEDAGRDAETFRTHGIKSNLTLPLIGEKEVFGALAFTMTTAERNWEEDEVMQLQLLAQVISNVMGRQRAELREEQLRRELTHAMRVATLGELAGAIAHELNQPLAAILSNAQAARRFLADGQIDQQELQAILDDVVRDDKRAGNVIHNLRSMVSKQPSVRSLCCLGELAKETLEILHSQLIAAGIVVRLRLGGDLPMVEAARVELQQVLMNLFVNAVHAMESAPPEARILEVETSLGENMVAVTVRDHGDGIPSDRLSTIFAPFFSTKATGLGLGLSICHRILENHSGRLKASNHSDGGAVFTLLLPVRMRQ